MLKYNNGNDENDLRRAGLVLDTSRSWSRLSIFPDLVPKAIMVSHARLWMQRD